MDDNIHYDDSLLSKIDRFLFSFEKTLTLLGGVVIFLLVFLSVANILGRWLFSMPVDGYIDWTEQAMTFFALLGIAYVQRQGAHIRMDFIVAKFHGRVLLVAELISTIFILLIAMVLTYGSYLHFLRAYQIGDSSLDIGLPTWPAKLVVPVALGLLSLRLILQIFAYIRAIKENNYSSPIALPVIEDVEQIAKKERDQLK